MKCSPSRSLFDQYTAPGVQLPYQLCIGNYVQESGGREASFDQTNTDAPYLMHQLCGYEGYKLYNNSPMPTAPRGNGWMLAGDEYVHVRCLYKPAPVAALELIKCGCKTSCKGHCLCKKNLPCTALSKCHTSDCSNLPDYRMIADEGDV